MKKYTVLICDDNSAVHKSITSYLTAEGINVLSAFSGEDAINILKNSKVDVAILDIMLPGMNGLDVCREIRKINNDIYIIILSAKDEEIDRIIGLEIGADDYVCKPFSPREITIRIRKILKRLYEKTDAVQTRLEYADVAVDTEAYQVYVDGRKVSFTPKEVDVLAFFIKNEGRVLSRENILDEVWGIEYFGDTRTVDSLIKRLRQKLVQEDAKIVIKSIYGVGYKLERSE